VKPEKAPGYWPTRILLAIAIGMTAGAILVAVASAIWLVPFSADSPNVFGLQSRFVVSLVACVVALVGLAWTIRIFRGPRDEPPPWRYRDR
jgi:hypothetical protein